MLSARIQSPVRQTSDGKKNSRSASLPAPGAAASKVPPSAASPVLLTHFSPVPSPLLGPVAPASSSPASSDFEAVSPPFIRLLRGSPEWSLGSFLISSPFSPGSAGSSGSSVGRSAPCCFCPGVGALEGSADTEGSTLGWPPVVAVSGGVLVRLYN
jgi:hypothetical protein